MAEAQAMQQQPAFAKRLKALRSARRVHEDSWIPLLVSDDWSGARDEPLALAISPGRYVPGQYDWRVVVGLRVEISWVAAPLGRIGNLMADVQDWARAVWWQGYSTHEVVRMCAEQDDQGRWVYPAWWTARREAAWLKNMAALVADQVRGWGADRVA